MIVRTPHGWRLGSHTTQSIITLCIPSLALPSVHCVFLLMTIAVDFWITLCLPFPRLYFCLSDCFPVFLTSLPVLPIFDIVLRFGSVCLSIFKAVYLSAYGFPYFIITMILYFMLLQQKITY